MSQIIKRSEQWKFLMQIASFKLSFYYQAADSSRQSEEPKKNSVGIFEYILASMLKVFLNM